jgi:hypothetical protein
MSGVPFLTLTASYFYNRWVVRFAKVIVQAVAVVLYCTPPIKTYGMAIATTLGMAFIGNPINNPSLLGKSKQVRFTV